MAAPLEVIVTSDSGSQLWNSTVFDLHSGSSLLSYRGGNSAARTLTVLNGEYLLSAQLGKNFINMWEIQRKVRNRSGTQPAATEPREENTFHRAHRESERERERGRENTGQRKPPDSLQKKPRN